MRPGEAVCYLNVPGSFYFLLLLFIMGNYRLKNVILYREMFKSFKIYIFKVCVKLHLNLTLKYGWKNKAKTER
jgi:hypothetical protein